MAASTQTTAGAHSRAASLALVRAFRRYSGSILAGALTMVVSVGLQVAIPWFLKQAFDALISSELPALKRATAFLVACVVGQAVTRIYSRVTLFNVGRLVEYDLRRDILDHLHRLSGAFFRRMGTGEIMSRAVNDLSNVRMLFGFAALNLLNTAFMFAFALTMMFAISVKLSFVSLLAVPVLVYTIRKFGRTMFTRSRAVQDHLGRLTARVQESLAGIRIVRAYGTEDQELAEFERLNQGYVDRNMALAKLRGFLFPLMGMVSGLGLLITLWFGGGMVADREISLGDLVAMQGYLAMLTWPTAALGYVLSLYQRGRASFDRIHELLSEVPEVPPPQVGRSRPTETGVPGCCTPPDGVPPTRRGATGDLRVERLSFSIGEQPVLRDVSFTVPRGSSLAVLGRTGSGKSTLANLLPRLLPTPAGAVFVGDRDITALPVEVLRRSVGYSPQDPFLFSTTVARNISFGLADPDSPDVMKRVRWAARAAQVDADVESFPDGYDTVVGERGVQLSGGQKQRIALARALVLDPEILILDDPLSAVDASTERRILDAIDEVAAGRTLIFVTHRCSAAARADDVIVLDEGRLVEHGTHEQLIAQGGIYATFYERQRLEEELEALAPAATAPARREARS